MSILITGYGVAGLSQSKAVYTLGAPSTPTVTSVNSDTLAINVSGIDSNASHVSIQIKRVVDSNYTTVATVLVGDLPYTLTDLLPSTSYNVRALSIRPGLVSSAPSSAQTSVTKALYVDGLVTDLGALNDANVDVQIWRNPPDASHTVGEHIDYRTGQQFEGSVVTVGGVDYVRLRVALPAQPATGAKLRQNDTVWLVARQIISGNSYWTPLLSGVRASISEV